MLVTHGGGATVVISICGCYLWDRGSQKPINIMIITHGGGVALVFISIVIATYMGPGTTVVHYYYACYKWGRGRRSLISIVIATYGGRGSQ